MGLMSTHVISIDESQRQLVLLALATLTLERPGFDYALAEIAKLMDNRTPDDKAEMYEEFKSLNLDKFGPQSAIQLKPRITQLMQAARAASHLCRSLLAVREGASDELIRTVAEALDAAISNAEGGG
jgi:hypothetical protein